MPYKPIYNVSSTASREFLRKPRDGPNVFGNACNGVANAEKFFVRLATVLQTPECFSWDLQRCCKRQKVFRGTCNSVANARKFFVGLATVLQTPESFSWDLQQCCKRQKVFRETCNGVANARKFFVALAAFLQTSRQTPRVQRNSHKGLCLRFGNTDDMSLMLLRLTFARPSKGDLHLII